MPAALNGSSSWKERLAYAEFGRALAHRMMLLRTLIQDYKLDSQCTVIALDPVLKAAACGLAHKGQLCRSASTAVVKTAYSMVNALEAQNHFATLPGRTQEYLFPLLPAAGSEWKSIVGIEEEEPPEDEVQVAQSPKRGERSKSSGDSNQGPTTPKFKRKKSIGVRSRLTSSITVADSLNDSLNRRSPGAANCVNLVDHLLNDRPARHAEPHEDERTSPKFKEGEFDWSNLGYKYADNAPADYAEEAQRIADGQPSPMMQTPKGSRKRYDW